MCGIPFVRKNSLREPYMFSNALNVHDGNDGEYEKALLQLWRERVYDGVQVSRIGYGLDFVFADTERGIKRRKRYYRARHQKKHLPLLPDHLLQMWCSKRNAEMQVQEARLAEVVEGAEGDT